MSEIKYLKELVEEHPFTGDIQDIFDTVSAFYICQDNAYEDLLKKDYEEMVQKVLNEIDEYGNYYCVDVANSIDDMKVAYFLGMIIFNENSNKDVLVHMIVALNAMLHASFPDKITVDEKIFRKLLIDIKHDNFLKNYGKYGVYAIFKNVYVTEKRKHEKVRLV